MRVMQTRTHVELVYQFPSKYAFVIRCRQTGETVAAFMFCCDAEAALGVMDRDMSGRPPESLPVDAVTATVSGEHVTVLRGAWPVLGVDLESGSVGHWPDGETWVRLAEFPAQGAF